MNSVHAANHEKKSGAIERKKADTWRISFSYDFDPLVTILKKEGQATHIAPLRPPTLATFPSWGIRQELVV